jgi:hypothetical protein
MVQVGHHSIPLLQSIGSPLFLAFPPPLLRSNVTGHYSFHVLFFRQRVVNANPWHAHIIALQHSIGMIGWVYDQMARLKPPPVNLLSGRMTLM